MQSVRDRVGGGGGVGRSGGPCGRPRCEWLVMQGQDVLDPHSAGRPQGLLPHIHSTPAPTRSDAFPSGFTKNLPVRAGWGWPCDREGNHYISICILPVILPL